MVFKKENYPGNPRYLARFQPSKLTFLWADLPQSRAQCERRGGKRIEEKMKGEEMRAEEW